MEKSWENFWTTGKVEDYLTYRNCLEGCEQSENRHGTTGAESQRRNVEQTHFSDSHQSLH